MALLAKGNKDYVQIAKAMHWTSVSIINISLTDTIVMISDNDIIISQC